MEPWSVDHNVFASDLESVTAVQRECRDHCDIDLNRAVSFQNIIIRWVQSLQTRGVFFKKRPGAPQKVRNPENVERLW